MSVINVLDTQTANLIAAGEVVDRPASVVKELLENAIDAGATKITAEIRGGGNEFIRITDNGCGMSRDDAALCVKRHATSKLSGPEDLAAIGTLGFRGEALAAISSVSRFAVVTKRPADQMGTKFEIEGDEIIYYDDIGCPDGTTVTVSELFKNQPARLKFMKRDATEASAVLQYVQRIAVSRPDIAFTFISNSQTKLQTTGDGDLKKSVYSVYGQEFYDTLTEVSYRSDDGISVGGFISRPDQSRPNRSLQSFYVNRRFVKSKTMLFAMEDAYKSYMKSDRFPGCVLMLDIELSGVDVNVHPAKLEVRFSNERAVYNAVYFAVKNALSRLITPLVDPSEKFGQVEKFVSRKENESKTFDFEIAIPKIAPYRPLGPTLRVAQPDRSEIGRIPEDAQQTSFKQQIIKEAFDTKDLSPSQRSQLPADQQDNSFDFAKAAEIAPPVFKGSVHGNTSFIKDVPVSPASKDEPTPGRLVGVCFEAFLIYEQGDSLFFIDKHAAHERLIYERLKKDSGADHVQLLLEPVPLDLTSAQKDTLKEHIAEIKSIGFDTEPFGPDDFVMRGVPMSLSGLPSHKISEILSETLSDIGEGGRANAKKESVTDRMLYTAACKAAVKAGIPDSDPEYRAIIKKLIDAENVVVCPHGRPIVTKITKKQLERLFLRS